MAVARVAGQDFDLDARRIERVMAAVDPEPVQEHYAVIGGRRYPPKQVLAVTTGLDRADFTTHQARAILRRLGFGVHRRGDPKTGPERSALGPHQGAEAEALAPYRGRWIAQDGLEILYDADSPEAVVRWLRRYRRTARVWRVPATRREAGSFSAA